jgi:Concanavalin A-like lectin/glucanases superfamily
MGYGFYRSITVDHTKCGSSDSPNFPVLVKGQYSYLATTVNSGKIQHTVTLNSQTVPADLVFTSDNLGANLLSWEIASYNPVDGTIEAWVKVANLSSSSDTVFYMFYGNAAVSTYQCTASDTWSNSFNGVWHFANGSTLSTLDTSGNGNNATAQSATAGAGQIDGGIVFGNGQYARGNMANVGFPMTCTAWVNFNSNGDAFNQIFFAHEMNDSNDGWRFSKQGSSTNYLNFTLGGFSDYPFSTFGALPAGSWLYVAVTVTANNGTATGYLGSGGVSLSSQAIGIGSIVDTPNTFEMSTLVWLPAQYMDGSVDEVRVANVVRNGDWLLSEYNNQRSPSTFYTVGNAVPLTSAARERMLTGVGT